MLRRLMTLLIILLISLFKIAFCNNDNNIINNNDDCLIQNFKYSIDYLHVSEKLDLSNYFDINAYTRRIYSNSPNSLKDMDKYRWKFMIFPDNNSNYPNYLIKISKYGEYLCASARHQSALFKKRRNVYTRRLHDKKIKLMLNRNDSSCFWRIKRIESSYMDHRYLIWNVKYNESLYTASGLFTTINDERSVFTWFDQPDSDQFYWLIHCIF
jgi:hypothetical protein